MNKKQYQAPSFNIHQVALVNLICGTQSTINEGKSNVGITYGGEGSGSARSRESLDWEDE